MVMVVLRAIGISAALISCSVALAQQSSDSAARPSFDCANAASALALTICSNQAAAAADWELISAYWAYRFQLGEKAQANLNESQNTWFSSLGRICGLPSIPGALFPRPTAEHASCVANAYRGRAAEYRAKLTGDALVEAQLTPEQHKEIQTALIVGGKLEGSADGTFGPRTRA